MTKKKRAKAKKEIAEGLHLPLMRKGGFTLQEYKELRGLSAYEARKQIQHRLILGALLVRREIDDDLMVKNIYYRT